MVTGYGSAPIVHGVSLSVEVGQVVLVLGANGCGKSTFLKGVVGLLPLHSGEVHLDGSNVTGFSTEKLAALGMGYVPQGDDTFAALTVKENLELGGYLLGRRKIPSRVAEVLEEVPVIGRLRGRVVATLSGGERKLVGVARALMLKPRLLVLDEPTASLTPEMSELILREFVGELASEGLGVLLVEQKAMEALAVAHLAHVLVSGEVFVTDRPEALADRQKLAAAFLGSAATSEEALQENGR